MSKRDGSVAIDLRDIAKTYTSGALAVPVLRNVSFRISSGEYVAIMGPSGSGKSTLMNLIGCLDRPTSGTYLLDNVDVSKLNDDELAEIRLRKIGFVFQGFNLLPLADALHNVALPLFYAAVPRRERLALAREALEQVGLGDRGQHRPSQLSGGEQQRVAIARALINKPAVLLADEPTGNLDSQTGEEVMAMFSQLHACGHTIIVVTHDQEIARRAGRLIGLRDGSVVRDTLCDFLSLSE